MTQENTERACICNLVDPKLVKVIYGRHIGSVHQNETKYTNEKLTFLFILILQCENVIVLLAHDVYACFIRVYFATNAESYNNVISFVVYIQIEYQKKQ